MYPPPLYIYTLYLYSLPFSLFPSFSFSHLSSKIRVHPTIAIVMHGHHLLCTFIKIYRLDASGLEENSGTIMEYTEDAYCQWPKGNSQCHGK